MYNTQEMDKIENAEMKPNRSTETLNRNIAKEEDSMESYSDSDETEGYVEPRLNDKIDIEDNRDKIRETRSRPVTAKVREDKPLRDRNDFEDVDETPGTSGGPETGKKNERKEKAAIANNAARKRPSTAIARSTQEIDDFENSPTTSNAIKTHTERKSPNGLRSNALSKHLETDVDAINDREQTLETLENEESKEKELMDKAKHKVVKKDLKDDKNLDFLEKGLEMKDSNLKKALKDGSTGRRHKERVRYADEDMKNISELLTQVKEDVVTGSAQPDSGVYIIEDNLYKAPSPLSPNLNPTSHLEHRTFVQLKSGFIQSSYEKSNVLDFDEKELCARSPHFALNSPLDIAIALQSGFQQMTKVCHGLLGGVSLFQLILVCFIESPDGSFRPPSIPLQSFHIFSRHDNPSWQEDMQGGSPGGQFQPPRYLSIQSYACLAHLPPALSILLLLLCVVSVLDRFDVSSNLSWPQLVHMVTFRKSVLCVVLYLVSLLLSLICYKYDEMFVYLAYYPNDLSFFKNFKSNDLSLWKQMTTARCSLTLLSSILLTLNDPQDLLQHNLKSIKTYESAAGKSDAHEST